MHSFYILQNMSHPHWKRTYIGPINLNLSVYQLHNFYGFQNMVCGVCPVNLRVNLIKRSNDFASSVTGAS